MARPTLPFRRPNLNGLPDVLAQLYAPDPKRGGFVLSVSGAVGVADEAPPEPVPGDGKSKNAAEERRDELVASAIARLGIKAEHAEAAERTLRKLIRVEQQDDGLVVECYHPTGFRWPSSLPGSSWCEFDEFVMRAAGNAEVVKPEWLLPAPPAPKPKEQVDREDSELLPRVPKNVRLPHGYSQADFERATKLAQERGGQVLFDPAPVEKPTLAYRPGKDIPVRHNEFDGPDGQARFEKMLELARQQGGEVVFLDPPPAEGRSTEFDGEGGMARFEAQFEKTRDGRLVTKVPPLSPEG